MELMIYVDRLKEGKTETFSGELSTDFLGDDPAFEKSLSISGVAYLAGDHLVVKIQAKTGAWIPCSICNKPTLVPINLVDFYRAEPLKEIPSVFDFSTLLREDILLQLPLFAECEGRCPEREELNKFLKNSEKRDAESRELSVQFPFSDL